MTFNKTRRPSFNADQRAAFIHTHGHTCHWCLGTIYQGQKWQVEHVIARELMEGKDADDPSNLRPIHTEPCHKAKTALDRKLIAKSNRIRRQADPETRRKSSHPIRNTGRKIPSRPFQNRSMKP